jgi:hypothetical protein
MEFVSNVEDILKVVGTVKQMENGAGIYMALPDDTSVDNDRNVEIHRIAYGKTQSGKRYIETVSSVDGNWSVYGEASLPEILAFAKKSLQDLPESDWTQELHKLSLKLEEALK